jgi:two-component system sensor histidine kinase MprB
MTLRARLTLATAAAVAAGLAGASALVYVAVGSELRAQVDDSLEAAVQAAAPADEAGGLVMLAPTPFGGVTAATQIVTPDGAAAPPGRIEPLLPVDRRTRLVAAGAEEPFFVDRTLGGTHVRIYTASVADGVAVQAARSLESVDAILARLRRLMLLASGGAIAFAIALGLAITRTTLRPVRRLITTTNRVRRTHDLSQRIATEGRGELAELAEGFNAMLAELEQAVAAQRNLVADASHELRTPLTSLRTDLEVLARGRPLTDEQYAELLGEMLRQSGELAALIDDVVELARGNEPPLEPRPFRLDEVVRATVERTQAQFPAVRIAMQLEPSVVDGEPTRVARAVRNLIENAAKWTREGSAVDVAVADGEVAVRDRGPGVAPQDAHRIFDRFYRADAARSQPGSGLGLAIVKQVAESNRGSVSVENASDGGAVFRLRLCRSDGDPEA